MRTVPASGRASGSASPARPSVPSGPGVPVRPAGPSDPPLQPSEGHGGDGWRLLTTAKDGYVAHLIEGLLAEDGIEVFLDRHNSAPGAFLKPFGDPLAPVKVFVKQPDLSRASLVLHEVDHRPPDPMAPGPRRARMLWIATISGALAAAMLMLLEILGFAPCLLNLFCL